MIFRAPVQKLSSEKHFGLASSPYFKTTVGEEEEQKTYSLSSGILAYYSPPSLRQCLGFFGVLVDYFRSGEAKLKLDFDLKLDSIASEWRSALVECFEFIKFTHYYDVIEAASAVHKILWDIFSSRRFDYCVAAVDPGEMQSCLEKLPPDNIVLKVIANVCVQVLAGRGSGVVDLRYLMDDVPDTSRNIIREMISKNHNLIIAMWKEALNQGDRHRGSDWKRETFRLQ